MQMLSEEQKRMTRESVSRTHGVMPRRSNRWSCNLRSLAVAVALSAAVAMPASASPVALAGRGVGKLIGKTVERRLEVAAAEAVGRTAAEHASGSAMTKLSAKKIMALGGGIGLALATPTAAYAISDGMSESSVERAKGDRAVGEATAAAIRDNPEAAVGIIEAKAKTGHRDLLTQIELGLGWLLVVAFAIGGLYLFGFFVRAAHFVANSFPARRSGASASGAEPVAAKTEN